MEHTFVSTDFAGVLQAVRGPGAVDSTIATLPCRVKMRDGWVGIFQRWAAPLHCRPTTGQARPIIEVHLPAEDCHAGQVAETCS